MQVFFTNWCFIINICIKPYAFTALLITYQNITKISFQCSLKLISIKKFHGTFSRVPWNFLNNIWTTPVVPWNSMEFKQQNLKFHAIQWNFVQTQSSMEFNGILSRPKVPWNLINFVFKKIIFLNSVFRIWLMIRCYWSKISMIRYILHWFQYRNSYFEHPSFSENGASSAKMACRLLYLQALEKQTEVVTVHLKPNWSRNCSS